MKTIKFFNMICLMLVLSLNFNSFGQDDDVDESKKDKIESMKIAFLTKKLDLTPAESEKFWPVYNEMDKKLKDIRKEQKKLNQDIKASYDTLTNDESRKKLQALIENDRNENTVKKEYYDRIAFILGYKKTLKLLNSEQDFKKELLQQLNATRQQNQEKKAQAQQAKKGKND